MKEIVLTKTASGALIPADPQAVEFVQKLKMGAGVTASVKRHNNPAFHRKMMALFQLGFEAWEPGELQYKGATVGKNFERFRKDITILAGFYESCVNLKGEVRLEAKSLNFSAMDQDEREKVYDAVIGVLLAKVLKNYTRADLDNVVEQIMRFA